MEENQCPDIDLRMNNGKPSRTCFHLQHRPDVHRRIGECSSMLFAGSCGPARHGVICRNSTVVRRRPGSGSTNGTAMEHGTPYCSDCRRCLSTPMKSTTSCGASMERPCVPRDVPVAHEKKGRRRTARPCVRPVSRGFFNENPHFVRPARPSVALLPDGGTIA